MSEAEIHYDENEKRECDSIESSQRESPEKGKNGIIE